MRRRQVLYGPGGDEFFDVPGLCCRKIFGDSRQRRGVGLPRMRCGQVFDCGGCLRSDDLSDMPIRKVQSLPGGRVDSRVCRLRIRQVLGSGGSWVLSMPGVRGRDALYGSWCKLLSGMCRLPRRQVSARYYGIHRDGEWCLRQWVRKRRSRRS